MYKFSVEGELSLLEGRWKNVVGDTILDSSLRVCSMKFVMNLTANIMAIYRLRWRTTSACIEGEGRGRRKCENRTKDVCKSTMDFNFYVPRDT
jgi:hypothetical protein